MSTVQSVNLEVFADQAQTVLQTARRAVDNMESGMLDSRCLLLGALASAAVWPDGFPLEAAVRALAMAAREPSLEQPGETEVAGVRMSREAEVTLRRAVELAQMGKVAVEHLLLALSDGTGSEASAVLRAVIGEADPWREVRPYVRGRLQTLPLTSAEGTGARARVEALLYLLMRDEVPFGKLARIVGELEGRGPYKFTNEGAAACATGLADRLWA